MLWALLEVQNNKLVCLVAYVRLHMILRVKTGQLSVPNLWPISLKLFIQLALVVCTFKTFNTALL
jgi:hypothetical protein